MSPDFYTPLDYAIACLQEARESYKENSDFDYAISECEIAKRAIEIAETRCEKTKRLFTGIKGM